MSPHKPDPPSGKVEVDLSEILIPPTELERTAVEKNAMSAIAWMHLALSERPPRITSSGWVNILFAIGSCLIGLYCTVSIVDSLENSRRGAHPPAEVAYRRPEAMTWQSFELLASRSPMSIQPNQVEINLSEQVIGNSIQAPTLSTAQPFRDSQRFALLPNFNGFTNNPISTRSSGAGPASMSQEASSSAETGNANRAANSKQSRTRLTPTHSRMSMLSSLNKISDGRQVLRSSLTQNSLGRAPMLMHAKAQAIVTMQNAAPMNSMRMQHGMIAQQAAGIGLDGLNGAGLGGAGRRGGGNARR